MKPEADFLWRDRDTLCSKKSSKEYDFTFTWRPWPGSIRADYHALSEFANLIRLDAKRSNIDSSVVT